MIVGGYSLHLYCDHPKHQEWDHVDLTGLSLDAEYNGHHEADCNKQAKARGWKLNFKARTCICPRCAKREQDQ